MKTRRTLFCRRRRRTPAQSMVEYLLLLGLMVVVLVVGFRELIPKTTERINEMYTNTVRDIVGDPPDTRVSGPYP